MTAIEKFKKLDGQDKKIYFALFATAAMLMMLLIVVFQNSKLRNTQIDNSAKANMQRLQTLTKIDTLTWEVHSISARFDSMDTFLKRGDTIFILYKHKSK